ncbi:glycoside hydrolase family 25 protein [Bittarella massiliensis (ex Durand et al. 2017)]|uniref:glycoside hydrolase family 25 protein n=1 Tax=Bittarella massiliensis (ex Durand et al. 2017) TaxID=1720313 RepID=UPI001AA1A1D7|nr:glycoside hydrolase family 25 protein [Bittarella massiliensis (ex Durand et al. 2017)]MBO1679911.1 hypothetical protein [Bittarella massiliensis (ex Durand et al. 2017)]
MFKKIVSAAVACAILLAFSSCGVDKGAEGGSGVQEGVALAVNRIDTKEYMAALSADLEEALAAEAQAAEEAEAQKAEEEAAKQREEAAAKAKKAAEEAQKDTSKYKNDSAHSYEDPGKQDNQKQESEIEDSVVVPPTPEPAPEPTPPDNGGGSGSSGGSSEPAPTPVLNGWQVIGGKTYLYINGNPLTGWQTLEGIKYKFDNSGVLKSRWGVDVSKYQGNVNWSAVKAAGCSFVMIRVGYRGYGTGAIVEDPYFRQNIAGAKAAGLKVGAYFYTTAINAEEAAEEAGVAAGIIRSTGYSLDYPLAIDIECTQGRVEGMTKAQNTEVVNAFCTAAKSLGYQTMVYANKNWLYNKLDTSQFGSYKIWLAHYTNQTDYSGRYNIWQYTSGGSVPGISGKVDMNVELL